MKEKKQIWSFLGISLLIAVTSGALAGIISSVYTNQSLDRYIQSLSESEGFVSISEVKPRPVPGTYEEALDRVQETGWPALALFLPKSVDSVRPQDWLHTQDANYVGMVITSDGWILSHKGSMPEDVTNFDIWVSGVRYEIDKQVADDLTEYVLVHVIAQGLPSVAFGASDSTNGGEIVFSLPKEGQVIASSIQSAQYIDDPVILPVELFASSWLVRDADAHGPLLNSSGELVGFIVDNSVADPIHHALGFVQSVLRSGAVHHAAIGANGVDLSLVVNIDSSKTGNMKFGVLLQPTTKKPAVLSVGPAKDAGLLVGDIILAIDDIDVTKTKSLSELIASYDVGDTAKFRIWRSGEVQTIEIVFGNYADLIY